MTTPAPAVPTADNFLRLLPAAWRLRFPPPVERRFVAHYDGSTRRTVRTSLAAGLVIYSLFGVVDRYAAPTNLALAWLYRFGVGGTSLLLALASTYVRAGRSWTQPGICLGAIGAGLGVVLHIRASAPGESAHSHYYVGLILTMMFTGSWVRLRCGYTLLANAAILGLYVGRGGHWPAGHLPARAAGGDQRLPLCRGGHWPADQLLF
jgi:hypothetical protein